VSVLPENITAEGLFELLGAPHYSAPLPQSVPHSQRTVSTVPGAMGLRNAVWSTFSLQLPAALHDQRLIAKIAEGVDVGVFSLLTTIMRNTFPVLVINRCTRCLGAVREQRSGAVPDTMPSSRKAANRRYFRISVGNVFFLRRIFVAAQLKISASNSSLPSLFNNCGQLLITVARLHSANVAVSRPGEKVTVAAANIANTNGTGARMLKFPRSLDISRLGSVGSHR
jgi:hypothetical protein